MLKELYKQISAHAVSALTGHMFDAVMSVGIGACNAQAAAEGGSVPSGDDHQNEIRGVDFKGATGPVRFGAALGRKGTRAEESVLWAAVNVFPPNYTMTDSLDPDKGNVWTEELPFVYADGRTTPPEVSAMISF